MQTHDSRILSLPQIAPPGLADLRSYSLLQWELLQSGLLELLSPSTFSFSLSPHLLSILRLISLPLLVLIFSFSHLLIYSFIKYTLSFYHVVGSVVSPGDTNSAIWITPSPLLPQPKPHTALKSRFKPQHPKGFLTDSSGQWSQPSVMVKSRGSAIR